MNLLTVIILIVALLVLISVPEYTTSHQTIKGSGLKIATMH